MLTHIDASFIGIKSEETVLSKHKNKIVNLKN